eukprot:Gb_08902 [translate_table: standard]
MVGWTSPYSFIGSWFYHWFWCSTPSISLTSYFPLVKGLLSSFTRISFLCPSEWTLPSLPFTHHYCLADYSSWCMLAPPFWTRFMGSSLRMDDPSLVARCYML